MDSLSEALPSDQGCLYSLLVTPRERIEDLLETFVRPVAEEIRDRPELDSLFFVRFSEPVWQLRFRVLGRAAWVNGPLRADIERRISELESSGLVERHELQRYDREMDRYGGPLGMALAEKLFHVDSLACLELVRIDRLGLLRKSRRELAMTLVDRFLDLTDFTDADRLAFYKYGYGWALQLKTWETEELATLEARFQKIRPGLETLFSSETAADPSRFYGGPEAASAVERFLTEARPIVEEILRELGTGAIHQDRIALFWSYTHMMTNRLGVEAVAEAILRFFMTRLLEERARTTA